MKHEEFNNLTPNPVWQWSSGHCMCCTYSYGSELGYSLG